MYIKNNSQNRAQRNDGFYGEYAFIPTVVFLMEPLDCAIEVGNVFGVLPFAEHFIFSFVFEFGYLI